MAYGWTKCEMSQLKPILVWCLGDTLLFCENQEIDLSMKAHIKVYNLVLKVPQRSCIIYFSSSFFLLFLIENHFVIWQLSFLSSDMWWLICTTNWWRPLSVSPEKQWNNSNTLYKLIRKYNLGLKRNTIPKYNYISPSSFAFFHLIFLTLTSTETQEEWKMGWLSRQKVEMCNSKQWERRHHQ